MSKVFYHVSEVTIEVDSRVYEIMEAIRMKVGADKPFIVLFNGNFVEDKPIFRVNGRLHYIPKQKIEIKEDVLNDSIVDVDLGKIGRNFNVICFNDPYKVIGFESRLLELNKGFKAYLGFNGDFIWKSVLAFPLNGVKMYIDNFYIRKYIDDEIIKTIVGINNIK